MIAKGDVVQVKFGPMFGHYSGRIGDVVATDAHPFPIRVKFHAPPDHPDRVDQTIMIDSREATAGFTEDDLVFLERPDEIIPSILHERDPRHE